MQWALSLLAAVIAFSGIGCSSVEQSEPTRFDPELSPDHFVIEMRVTGKAPARQVRINVRNISDASRHFVMLTNFFEGEIILKGADGVARSFMQREFVRVMLRGFLNRATVTLPPDSAIAFDLALSEFIEWEKMGLLTNQPGPNLEDEFKTGTSLHVELRLVRRRTAEDNSTRPAEVGRLVSERVH